MKLTSILVAILLLPSLAFAQAVGTCDQYQPGPNGGQVCLNNGSVSEWVNLFGDISCTKNSVLCSPTNNSGCGKCSVQGLGNIPFNGSLAPGQTWCLNSSGTQMIPCFTGGTRVDPPLVCGTTVTVVSDGMNSVEDEYLLLCSNTTTINTPCANQMPDGKIIHLIIQQPAGSFNYTSPTCFTACSGTQVKVTGNVSGGTEGTCGGTGAVPVVGLTTNAMIEYGFEYHATVVPGDTPTIEVLSAAPAL